MQTSTVKYVDNSPTLTKIFVDNGAVYGLTREGNLIGLARVSVTADRPAAPKPTATPQPHMGMRTAVSGKLRKKPGRKSNAERERMRLAAEQEAREKAEKEAVMMPQQVAAKQPEATNGNVAVEASAQQPAPTEAAMGEAAKPAPLTPEIIQESL